MRLDADDTFATHFLDFVIRVGNDPVTPQQFDRFTGAILDMDRIREHEPGLLGYRLLLDVGRFDGDADFLMAFFCHALI